MATPDPLYVIFEQHLLNFEDNNMDRKSFTTGVVREYLHYLRQLQILIPKPLEAAIMDELGAQVGEMLTRKIYGCLSIDDYRKTAPANQKTESRRRYSKLRSRVR